MRGLLEMKYSQVVVPHGLDAVQDLWHLVVDHAVQLAVSHPVSVHNDARRQAVVELHVVFQSTWNTNKNIIALRPRLLIEN